MIQRLNQLFGGLPLLTLMSLAIACSKPSNSGEQDDALYNISYMRDYQYLQQIYYYVGMTGPERKFETYQDSIVDFKLFKPSSSSDPEANPPWANVYVDPDDSTYYADELFGAYVELIENANQEDYFLEPREFWIRLDKLFIPANHFLAYWMVVQKKGGTLDTVGAMDTEPKRLKLLKAKVRHGGLPTWHYEWKNVYDLGVRNISYDDFELDIYLGARGTEEGESNPNHQDSIPYLQLLGLDLYNEDGTLGSDGKIDSASYLLDLVRGHVTFPNCKPFAPDPDTGYAPSDPDARLEIKVPEIYTTSNETMLRDRSIYYLKISIASRFCGTADKMHAP